MNKMKNLTSNCTKCNRASTIKPKSLSDQKQAQWQQEPLVCPTCILKEELYGSQTNIAGHQSG